MSKFRNIFLFILIAGSAFSQSVFAPPGTYFSYNYMDDSGAYTGVKTMYYTSDTIIDAVSYKKICNAYDYHCICPNPHIYHSGCDDFLLERNDSLYQFFPLNDSLQLLYSFNTAVGDSVLFNYPDPSQKYKNVLDSIGTLFICGMNRQVLYYSIHQNFCSWALNVLTVAKGIGPIDDYLFTQSNGCDLTVGRYTFNCVNVITSTYPSGTCYSEPLSLSENVKNNEIIISSNLKEVGIGFSRSFTGTISVKTIFGNIVYETDLDIASNFTISCDEFSSGIYIISCNSKSLQKPFIKKIVIE